MDVCLTVDVLREGERGVAHENLRVPVNFFIASPFMIHLRRGSVVQCVCFLNCLELLRILSLSIFSFELFLFILFLCPPRNGYLTRSFSLLFYAILRVCENNRRCDLLSNVREMLF